MRFQTRGQVVNVNQKPEVKYPVTVRMLREKNPRPWWLSSI